MDHDDHVLARLFSRACRIYRRSIACYRQAPSQQSVDEAISLTFAPQVRRNLIATRRTFDSERLASLLMQSFAQLLAYRARRCFPQSSANS